MRESDVVRERERERERERSPTNLARAVGERAAAVSHVCVSESVRRRARAGGEELHVEQKVEPPWIIFAVEPFAVLKTL